MTNVFEGAAFPVGTRVRAVAGYPTCAGEVLSPLDGVQQVCVRWDGGLVRFYEPEQLERIDPPRGPERVLALGIVQSDNVCDGRPRVAGTGISTRALYAFWNEARIDWPEIKQSYDVTAEQHHVAVAFEAGRFWERERRRRRKERRLARRYERAKALAEGKVDDRV